jgi:ethanolamine phosphate transferase 2 subunit G
MSPSFPESESKVQCPVDPTDEFLYYSKIQQSDLVPTISTLLGWTIPRNNIGVLIKSLLNQWTGTFYHDYLTRVDVQSKIAVIASSVVQMSRLVRLSRPDIFSMDYVPDNDLSRTWSHCKKSLNDGPARGDVVVEACFEFLVESQSLLSSASTDYRVSYMYLGLITLLFSVILLGTLIFRQSTLPTLLRYEFITITLGFGGIMFASSYVEEEQQFWYWIVSGHFALAVMQRYVVPEITKVVYKLDPFRTFN